MPQLATGCVHAFVGTQFVQSAEIDTRSSIQTPYGSEPNPNYGLPLESAASQTTIDYLGTCEDMPKDERHPQYQQVMTDRSGVKIPFDMAWQGMTAQISLTMTRVIQPTVEFLLQNPTSLSVRFGIPGLLQSSPEQGSWLSSDVGTMMMLEGWTFELYLVYQFTGITGIQNPKQAYLDAGLRKGRRYPQCILYAPQSEETGTKPMKQHLMFFSWPKEESYRGSDSLFTLYDYDIPANIGIYIK